MLPQSCAAPKLWAKTARTPKNYYTATLKGVCNHKCGRSTPDKNAKSRQEQI